MTELFHLSTENHNGETFFPRVPKTAADNEDTITPRVCFAPSFEKCVLAINPAGDCCAEYIYFVHVPVNSNTIRIPTDTEVPDVDDTNEVWICSPVKLKCIGKAIVTYSMVQDMTIEFVSVSSMKF